MVEAVIELKTDRKRREENVEVFFVIYLIMESKRQEKTRKWDV